MRRSVTQVLGITAAIATLAAATAVAAPAPGIDATRTVVFVSGLERGLASGGSIDCERAWRPIEQRLRTRDVPPRRPDLAFSGDFDTVGFSNRDVDCDINARSHAAPAGCANGARPANPLDERLDVLACHLAWALYDTYTVKSTEVDVVADGSAGILVRYALAMAERQRLGRNRGSRRYPEEIRVEDVVTLGTPHAGTDRKALCTGHRVCAALDASRDSKTTEDDVLSALNEPQAGLARHPDDRDGVDWTTVGRTSDAFVSPTSARAMGADHWWTSQDEAGAPGYLDDASALRDAHVEYGHRDGPAITWRHAWHVADEVAHALSHSPGPAQERPAPGCVGYSDIPGASTVTLTTDLAEWTGPRGAMTMVRFGVVDAISPCFRADDGCFITQGPARINGIEFTPSAADAATRLCPAQRRLIATHVDVAVPSRSSAGHAIKLLADTDIDWVYPKGSGPVRGSEGELLGTTFSAGRIGGLVVRGGISANVVDGATTLSLSLALPGVFGTRPPIGPLGALPKSECVDDFDNDGDSKIDWQDETCRRREDSYESRLDGAAIAITVRTTNTGGLEVDRLAGAVDGDLNLGRFKVGAGLWLAYSFSTDQWDGRAEVTLPIGPTVQGNLSIKGGALKALGAEVNGLNAGPLFGSIYLQRVKLGLELDPPKVLVGGAVSLGPRVARRYSLLEVNGDWTFGDASTRLDGSVSILGDAAVIGTLEVLHGRGVQARLQYNRGLGVVGDPNRNMIFFSGWMTGAVTADSLDVTGFTRMCVRGVIEFLAATVDPTCVGQATMRLSKYDGPLALSACAGLRLLGQDVSVGAWARFRTADDYDWDLVSGACDVDRWHERPRTRTFRTASSTETQLTLPAADRPRVLAFRGDGGGAPRIALTGPRGLHVTIDADDKVVRTGGAIAFVSPGNATTYVVAPRGPAGRWTADTSPDAPRIVGVDVAATIPPPRVRAAVHTLRSRLREVTFRATSRSGQRVVFLERAPGLHRVVHATAVPGGRFRFQPATAGPRRRSLVATVLQRGIPRAELVVARYVAPHPPRAGHISRPRVRWRGNVATITWDAAADASGYVAFVGLPDGRTVRTVGAPGARRAARVHVVGPHRLRVGIVSRTRGSGELGPMTRVTCATTCRRLASSGNHPLPLQRNALTTDRRSELRANNRR